MGNINKKYLTKEAKTSKKRIIKPTNTLWGFDWGNPSAMGAFAHSKNRGKKR